MQIDNNTICIDVSPCVDQYYTYSHFLFEQRGWPFMNFYNSFIMMLFTHDAFVAFSVSVFFQLIEEGSMALSVWTGQSWIRMKTEWDAADTAFDMLSSILGVTVAILLIWIIRSPKLIRSPYLQLALMKNEYGLEYKGESFKKITQFTREEYSFIKWKYIAQVVAIQLIPCRTFYFISSNEDGDPPITGFLRIDLSLYFFFNTLFIILCMMVNNITEIETDIFWKGDTKRYYKFHGLWFFVLVLLMAPSFYVFTYTKILMLIGVCAIYAILIPSALFVSIYQKNIPPLSFKFWF